MDLSPNIDSRCGRRYHTGREYTMLLKDIIWIIREIRKLEKSGVGGKSLCQRDTSSGNTLDTAALSSGQM